MIQIFLDQDPGMQARRRQAAVDARRGNRGRRDGFAVAAGILRTNVAMYKKASRFNIELFADVFADLDEIAPTVAAGAGFRFVPVFDARQFERQGIATGAFVLTRRSGRLLCVFQFGNDGGPILIAGLDKQIPLLARQGFALAAKADPSMMRQFEGQLLDLQVAPFEFGVTFNELRLQGADLRPNRFRQG